MARSLVASKAPSHRSSLPFCGLQARTGGGGGFFFFGLSRLSSTSDIRWAFSSSAKRGLPLLGELRAPKPMRAAKSSASDSHCRDLLGGLIHEYYRAVARAATRIIAPFMVRLGVSLVSGTSDGLGDINVPVVAKRGMFYEAWWSGSGAARANGLPQIHELRPIPPAPRHSLMVSEG
jgi:hypothetical protein